MWLLYSKTEHLISKHRASEEIVHWTKFGHATQFVEIGFWEFREL